MRKNKQNKSLYSIIMITMLSLFVIACGGGGGELGGDPVLTGTVSISGTAEVGRTLAAVISADTNGIGTPEYQWERINGLTTKDVGTDESTYIVTTDDIGGEIIVTVSYSGNLDSITSDKVGPVAAAILTGTVNISGTAEVGRTLMAVISADTNGAGTPKYQWKCKIGVNTINVGTDSSTYIVATGDIGGVIIVTVSYDSFLGSITSEPTLVVLSAAGTSGNPFLVNNKDDLQHVGKPTTSGSYDGWTLSAHYKQEADIDLSSVTNWTSIGNNSTYGNSSRFTGSYDGNHKKISKLKIYAPTSDYQGLFGYISGDGTTTGIVKNLGLVDAEITGKSNVGGVVGYNDRGTVKSCYATGSVVATGGLGGVVGINYYGTIQNCYATSDVSGDYFTGGLVGQNIGSTVENCFATGDVVGTGSLGGVVGYNSSTVKNCYATGNVVGTDNISYTGGVVGDNNGGTVENCYATGSVTGTVRTGGVVGDNYTAILQNSVAFGSSFTSVTTPFVGRVAGNSYSATLSNNYARSNMAGTWSAKTHNGKDGADLAASNYYNTTWWTGTAGWSFSASSSWNAPVGSILPTLKNMPGDRTQNPKVP